MRHITHRSRDPPITVRASHASAVTDIAYHVVDNYAFSAGADGKLMVWDLENGRLLQTIRADDMPIRQIAVYPDGERVAVHASNGEVSRISVWNWTQGMRIFLHTPSDTVLSFAISPRGSYIAYSVPSLRSIRMIDGDSGRTLPFLRYNSGIVNSLVFSAGEERLMSYAPATGALDYRTIITGRSAARFDAPPNLTHLTILSNNRYAAAYRNDGNLVAVDLLSGETVSTIAANEPTAITTDSQGVIYALPATSRRSTVSRYRFVDRRLEEASPFELPPATQLSSYAMSPRGEALLGMANGSIYRISSGHQVTEFAYQQIEPINDLYIAENVLHLATTARTLRLDRDFFATQRRDPVDGVIYADHAQVPYPNGNLTAFLEDRTTADRVLVRNEQRGKVSLQRYDSERSLIDETTYETGNNPLAIDLYNGQLLTVQRSGEVTVNDSESGETTLSYRGRGIQTGIITSRGVFLGRTAEENAAILRLNSQTGETVPIRTRASLVFQLHFDEQRGRLYAIGILRESDQQISTIIEIFEGTNFARRRQIITMEGEYLDAVLTHDPTSGTVYTTLDDRGGVLRWDGRRTRELLRNQAHIPYELHVAGDLLFSVNRDGSLSVIDRSAGVTILDLYIIQGTDGGWFALRPDGRFVASRDQLIDRTYLSANQPLGRLADQRIELRTTNRADGAGDNTIHRFDSGEISPDVLEYDAESGAPAPSS